MGALQYLVSSNMGGISTLTNDSSALGHLFRIRSIISVYHVWTVVFVTNALFAGGPTLANIAFQTIPDLSTNSNTITDLDALDLGSYFEGFANDFVTRFNC